MSRILIFILFLSLILFSDINCKKRKHRGKDTGCHFCNQFLGRSSDESGLVFKKI